MLRILVGSICLVTSAALFAADAPGLTHAEAASGLKQALTDGSAAAVAQLGRQDGFLGNPKVRIPLPPALQRVESALRYTGMRKQADELVVAMNRAAEAAVPEARALLVTAVRNMTLKDAKGILTGCDTAATDYFRRTTQSDLARRFLPIVKKATDQVGLADQYNGIASQLVQLGLMKKEHATIEAYVTQKTLDGLYLMIGEQEKSFRQNPLAATSEIVKRIFSSAR
jgi:hypothetical protein